MIIFGRIKLFHGDYLCDDRFVPRAASAQFRLVFFRESFLLVIVIKDHAPVLSADVAALAVETRRIVHLEKNFEQFIVRNLRRIKNDLCTLSVTSFSTTDFLISGIYRMTA